MNEIFMHLALSGDTWVLVVLLMASVASIGVMIERARFYGRNRGDFTSLLDGFAACMAQGDIAGAGRLAEQNPRVEARVALAGLRALGLWLAPRVMRHHLAGPVGPDPELAARARQLTQRVQTLTKTRHDAVDTAAAELRRIERDLHDGAQARLVALGMSLRAAVLAYLGS